MKMKISCLIFFVYVTVKVFCACPNGWEAHTTSCYHFSHDTETWIGAEDICRDVFDAHLVEVNTPQENLYLETQARARNASYWIGLNDLAVDGTWVWIGSKQTLTSTGFSDWAPGEPNNYVQGEEGCVALFRDLGYRWTDAPCKYADPHYICEKENRYCIINADTILPVFYDSRSDQYTENVVNCILV